MRSQRLPMGAGGAAGATSACLVPLQRLPSSPPQVHDHVYRPILIFEEVASSRPVIAASNAYNAALGTWLVGGDLLEKKFSQ